MCVYSAKALSKVQSMHEIFPLSATAGLNLTAILVYDVKPGIGHFMEYF